MTHFAFLAEGAIACLEVDSTCSAWQVCLEAGNDACWRKEPHRALHHYRCALDYAYRDFESNRELDSTMAVSSVVVSLLNLASTARQTDKCTLALKCYACGYSFLLRLQQTEFADKVLMSSVNSFFSVLKKEWSDWQAANQ